MLSLIPKSNFSVLEYEKQKKIINRLLYIEFVEKDSIYWDELGDLFFSPPVHKMDQNYWIHLLNSEIDGNNWEFTNGRII